MVKVIPTAFLLLFLMVACAPPPASGVGGYSSPAPAINPAVQATIAARQAQDAAATFEAVEMATTQSIQSTQAARDAATSTAVSAVTQTAVAATSTAEMLSARATEIALVDVQTRNAIAAQGTSTTQAAEIAAHLTREAQEMANIEMARADKERMLTNMREREAMWNRTIPVLLGAIGFLLFCAAGYAAIYLWRQRQPVINVTINGRQMPLVLDGGGGYKLLHPARMVEDEPLMLPAGETAVSPEPLPPLAEGHVLIAGPTRSGKSTAMRALLEHRRDIVVLDPHAAPGDWNNAQVKGAGRNFQEIGEFMEWMLNELDSRAQARARGITDFPDMTVATDEMPAIADELGRDTYTIWQKWVREGWKFGLYFIVSTQSTRVKTLGIQGEKDILANFVAAILLGEEATTQYPDMVVGMNRPAIIKTLQGARPVIIPHVRPSHHHGHNGSNGNGGILVPPPMINLPQRTQAEIDGRALDDVIHELRSLNAAGTYLDPSNPLKPSGQFLQDRLRPALEWRVNHLQCPHALRLLARYEV